MKNYKYRIYPNRTQRKSLESTLYACQQVYNKCLEQRIELYKDEKKSTTAYNQISWIKTQDIDLLGVHSQVIQNAVLRLDNAFKQFFRRCKTGETPGFPRFKSVERYNSFCYPQSGFTILDKAIKLSKIGTVKLIKHRDPVKGKIKNCTVSRNSLGHWFVVLVIDDVKTETATVDLKQPSVGIDLGCATFLITSNGDKVEHPHYYRKSEKELKKAQSRYAQVKNLDRNDKYKIKAKRKLLRIHEKIKNQRTDFLHKTSRKLVDEHCTIFHEDLNIRGMTEDNYRNLNKSILDSGWGQFISMVTYKAEDAGKKAVPVNPAYTSQICSTCGTMCPKELKDRVHTCTKCGLHLDRDVNAAINILRFGTNLCAGNRAKSR